MKNLLLILSASCLGLVFVNDQRDRATLAATRDAIARLTPAADEAGAITEATATVDINDTRFGTRSLAQLYAAKSILTESVPATSHHHERTANKPAAKNIQPAAPLLAAVNDIATPAHF